MLIGKLIEFKDVMFNPAPAKILLLYRKMQPIYESWREKYSDYLEMAEGVDVEALERQKENWDPRGTFVILDDLMGETVSDSYISTLFTAGRHYNVSETRTRAMYSARALPGVLSIGNACLILFLFQICGVLTVFHNLFPKGKNARLIALNCTGYILMRSPRIAAQVPELGRQLSVRKSVAEAYQLATINRPFSYLIVDFTNRKEPDAWIYAFRTSVFPSDPDRTIVFGARQNHAV